LSTPGPRPGSSFKKARSPQAAQVAKVVDELLRRRTGSRNCH
jgi:hypothetical protein